MQQPILDNLENITRAMFAQSLPGRACGQYALAMSDLWLGLAFSIPVGIAVNLLSGPVQRYIGHLSQRVERRRAARDRTFAEFASTLATDPALMQMFAFETLIRIAFYGALFGTASTALWVYNYFSNLDFLIGLVGQMTALMGTVIVMNVARSGMQTLSRARKYREG